MVWIILRRQTYEKHCDTDLRYQSGKKFNNIKVKWATANIILGITYSSYIKDHKFQRSPVIPLNNTTLR